ncbi:MAG: hypothetical protein ACRCXC_01330 [Legionella sp.]
MIRAAHLNGKEPLFYDISVQTLHGIYSHISSDLNSHTMMLS